MAANDILVIKKCNTGTGTVEVHRLDAANSYQSWNLEIGTVMEQIKAEELDQYTFKIDHNSHGIAVCRMHMTGSDCMEMHMMSSGGTKQPYDRWAFQIASICGCMHRHTCHVFLAANSDMVCVCKDEGTTTATIYRLAASTLYRSIAQVATVSGLGTGIFEFIMAANDDLVCIKKSECQSGKTEVHILTAATGYQQFSLHTATPIEMSANNWQYALNQNGDLVGIKKNQCQSGKTEVHILSAASSYQGFSFQMATCLEQVDDTFEFIMPMKKDRDANYLLSPEIQALLQSNGEAVMKEHAADVQRLANDLKTQLAQLDAFNVAGWNDARLELERKTVEVAISVDKLHTGTNVTKTVSGSIGVVGGVLSLVGLAAAPFTLGASLSLAAVGAGLGIASGVATGVTTVLEGILQDNNLREVDNKLSAHKAPTEELSKIIQGAVATVGELAKLANIASLKTLEAQPGFRALNQTDKNWAIVKATGSLFGSTVKVALKSYGLFEAVRTYQAYNALSRSVTFGAEFLEIASKAILAPGFAVPLAVKTALGIAPETGVVVTAASVGAKALNGVFAVVGIGFSIYDIVTSAKELKNGSQAAKNLRQMNDNLEAQRKIIMEAVDCFKHANEDPAPAPAVTEFMKVTLAGGVPAGWRWATYSDVLPNRAKVVSLMGYWDIAKLKDGWIDGPGYGGVLKKEKRDGLGHMIVVRP